MTNPEQDGRRRPEKSADPGVDMDPYLTWVNETGSRQFFRSPALRKDKWTPVLLKLSGISVKDFAAGKFNGVVVEDFAHNVKVPLEYTQSPDASDKDNPYCVAMVALEYFNKYLKDNVVIAGFELTLPLDASALGAEFGFF